MLKFHALGMDLKIQRRTCVAEWTLAKWCEHEKSINELTKQLKFACQKAQLSLRDMMEAVVLCNALVFSCKSVLAGS